MEMDGGQKNQIIVCPVLSTDIGKKSLDGQRARLQSNAYLGFMSVSSTFHCHDVVKCIFLHSLLVELLIAILWRTRQKSDDENPTTRSTSKVIRYYDLE